MSLKGFHVIFIIASIALCIFFGAWALSMHKNSHGSGYIFTAVVSFAVALGLCLYEVYFLKKVKS